MSFIHRLFLVCLLSIWISAATTAQAGNQLFEASWTVKAFGNERTGGTGESEFYSAYGLPLGVLCNANQPRCPFDSTPTDGSGNFAYLGGHPDYALYCAPWTNWRGYGTTARPAKGATAWTGRHTLIPPLYRNPQFFTPGGEPDTESCSADSTGATPGGKGRVQAGDPVAGTWTATTTGAQKGGFGFAPAPENHAAGIRTTAQVGEFPFFPYPYVYSYTYATLRNDAGVFGPGKGPGNFNLIYKAGTQSVASINVKQGAAKFGGTMKMLGALTTKVCYYRLGYCSLGEANWRYEAIGAPAYTYGGVVTRGYVATYLNWYYHPHASTDNYIELNGHRFPWTTGSVTVTATGRGPHKTVHYAHGYDNRNTTTPSGKGTIQLVSPVLTRWLHPAVSFETVGIGILRIKFVPEPDAWVMLVTGAALLGVGARMRGR